MEHDQRFGTSLITKYLVDSKEDVPA